MKEIPTANVSPLLGKFLFSCLIKHAHWDSAVNLKITTIFSMIPVILFYTVDLYIYGYISATNNSKNACLIVATFANFNTVRRVYSAT